MKNPRKTIVPFGLIILIILASLVALDLSRRSYLGEFKTNTIKFEMLYSSEKAQWLEEVGPIFEAQWNANHSQAIQLILNPIGSGKGTIQVARGLSKPVVWSPASRFWLSTLNYLWGNPSNNIVDTNSQALVVSPTVIATWKSYYNTHNITGMEDLRRLALTDPSFTYAHTDPSSSNSGFGGVIMQVAVATNKTPEEITLADLAKDSVQKWMRQIESAAVEYGASTGFLAKTLQTGGPSKLKVALLYENLVVEKNKGIDKFGYNDSLVAVYPIKGTVLNDHPYGILNAPWVTPEQKVIAQAFLKFLNSEKILEKAIKLGFRPPQNLITPHLEEVEKDVFNETVGVKESIANITTYNIGNIPGDVLERIPDLWFATRSLNVGSGDTNAPKFSVSDWIFPSILFALMIIMVTYPIYQYIHEKRTHWRVKDNVSKS